MSWDRCSICPRTNRCVPADGPLPCSYLFIGEAPGREEDRGGRPFIGASGKEFNENYLHLAGLTRSDIRITNTVRCRPQQNRKPREKEVEGCADWHLPDELAETQPEVVFLMGATACSLVPSVQLEVEHGIPQWCEDLYGWSGWVVPMYHPASGLHDTGMMIPMLEDWERLKPWIETKEWVWPEDEYPNRHYKLVRTVQEVDHYFMHTPRSRFAGVDTESHADVPFSVQVSIKPGTGIMVLLDAEKYRSGTAKVVLAYWLAQSELVFHNAPADIPILEALMRGDPFVYRDTMQEAYHLGNLPQGLKALGYRLCGVRMKSWEDMVLPYSKAMLIEWMKVALDLEMGRPIVTEKQLKTKLKVIEKPNDEEKLLRRVLRYTQENPDYDPWEKLEGVKSVDLAGEYPLKGIAHVPLAEAVDYAVKDADLALRVALLFESMRADLGDFGVSEEDYDNAHGMV